MPSSNPTQHNDISVWTHQACGATMVDYPAWIEHLRSCPRARAYATREVGRSVAPAAERPPETTLDSF